MTEADWLSSDDPAMLLRHLTRQTGSHGETAFNIPREPPIVSERKLSLWAAACWRLITPHNPIHEARAVDVEAGIREWKSLSGDLFPSDEYSDRHADECDRLHPTWAALLRCVVGNPWRPVTTVTRGGRFCHPTLWLTDTVTHLAAGVYEDRAWERLPILADALEEAGCEGQPCGDCHGTGRIYDYLDWQVCGACKKGRVPHPLLAALRGAGPWCKGFWVLDLLLGKE